MSAPQQLLSRLRSDALRRGFQVQDDPPALHQSRMQANLSAGGKPDIEPPEVVLGFIAKGDEAAPKLRGQYTIMIGAFSPEERKSEAVAEVWRRYHGQAAITRSWLPESMTDDLCLMLVGPEGSAVDPFWVAEAAEIERNDFVCRKLVWLPPPPAAGDEELTKSLDRFVGRTFLAEPWEVATGATQHALDTLATSLADFPEMGVPAATMRAWLAELEDFAAGEETERDPLVSKLIAAMPIAPDPR